MPRKTKEFLPPLPKKVSADVERTLRTNRVYGTETVQKNRPKTPSLPTPKTASADVLPYLQNIGTNSSRVRKAPVNSQMRPETRPTPQERARARDIIKEAHAKQTVYQAQQLVLRQQEDRAKKLSSQNLKLTEPLNPPKKVSHAPSNNTSAAQMSSGYLGESAQGLANALAAWYI
jgi:hypothetical protein